MLFSIYKEAFMDYKNKFKYYMIPLMLLALINFFQTNWNNMLPQLAIPEFFSNLIFGGCITVFVLIPVILVSTGNVKKVDNKKILFLTSRFLILFLFVSVIQGISLWIIDIALLQSFKNVLLVVLFLISISFDYFVEFIEIYITRKDIGICTALKALCSDLSKDFLWKLRYIILVSIIYPIVLGIINYLIQTIFQLKLYDIYNLAQIILNTVVFPFSILVNVTLVQIIHFGRIKRF